MRPYCIDDVALSSVLKEIAAERGDAVFATSDEMIGLAMSIVTEEISVVAVTCVAEFHAISVKSIAIVAMPCVSVAVRV